MIYLLCEKKQNYDAFKIIVDSKLINYLNKITMTDNIHGRDNVIMKIKKINLDNIYELYKINENEKRIIDLTINK